MKDFPTGSVAADPYPWPWNGNQRPENTALIIIDKSGKRSFCATDRELILHTRGIGNIIRSGMTTDVCASTTMREANDRGFECLLLEDCCGATDPANHTAAVNMVKMQGGVFCAVSDSATLIAALA